MNYITTKEAAEKWGITKRRIQFLCRQGKIEGVVRLAGVCAIPKDSKKLKIIDRKNKCMEGTVLNESQKKYLIQL
ncbi:hypothetical protein SAMN05878443_1961 [Carnobacterium alterfunditum]|uniref:Helix-turn-helix domain-containing protein n=1 Tax=Carnobacterium alterfunditum TaxID=28230 RepID=A0A1N6HMG4_9LACT|nr:DNA-binding protein [Carnobacterium alterfunditum]SIO21048.1 hypothetical protein SAMN05878443_1961 [Carnobacterium alterfunditum]